MKIHNYEIFILHKKNPKGSTVLKRSPDTWSWERKEVLHLFPILNMYIAPGHGHTTTWYKFWQYFKVFIISIILYQFQKDPFCLIILYDILFYLIHVHIAKGKVVSLGENYFDGSRKVLSL